MKKIKLIPMSENSLLSVNIDKSKKYLPDWYKKSPSRMKNFEKYHLVPNEPITTSTYKQCAPFLDAMSNGYTFYLAKDIEVIIREDGSPYIMWRDDSLEPVTWHLNEQWEGLVPPENYHKIVYKWQNHFRVKTPRGYSTIFTHPHNRFDLPFQTISGIVDTDKYVLGTHFPFFLKENFSGIIKAGTPVCQMNFIKRKHWYRSIGKYNAKNIKKNKFMFFSNIEKSYKKLFWQNKNFD